MVSSNYVNKPNNKRYSYYEPSSEIKERLSHNHDHLLSGNIINKTKATLHKTAHAFTTYPAKGLKGDQNSSFYEFLSMGVIPSIVGSLAMIGIFNAASTKFSPDSKKAALKIGKKLGAGVVLYFLAKELAKSFINVPVKAATGVDLNQPYKRIVHELPPNGYEKGKTRIEYHKVFESADFSRWDLFYDQGNHHGNRNEYFDKIAKKNGYGELHASDQEMKPKIKELIIKSQTWKTLLSYAWAATAVGIAAQSPWEELFVNKGNKNQGNRKILSNVGSMLKRSFVEMWQGGLKKTKSAGIAGKALIGASIVGAVVAPIATISGFKAKHETKQVIDKTKRYYEA